MASVSFTSALPDQDEDRCLTELNRIFGWVEIKDFCLSLFLRVSLKYGMETNQLKFKQATERFSAGCILIRVFSLHQWLT